MKQHQKLQQWKRKNMRGENVVGGANQMRRSEGDGQTWRALPHTKEVPAFCHPSSSLSCALFLLNSCRLYLAPFIIPHHSTHLSMYVVLSVRFLWFHCAGCKQFLILTQFIANKVNSWFWDSFAPATLIDDHKILMGATLSHWDALFLGAK